MEKTPDFTVPTGLEPLRRYVPLVIWVIVLMTLLLIPLRVIQYDYIPPDDALRSAAKAVSGKSWDQVLVLNDEYKIDHEYGWSLLLAKFHTAFNADPDAIVIFSVVSLFVLAGLAAVPWLRYPEVWLITLALAMTTVLLPFRLLLGRPYIITLAALMSLLLLWRQFGPGKPKGWMMALMTGLITISVYFHGAWYLWALPVAAFFFAGQFRWMFTVAGCAVAGVFLGCLLTGHLIEYPMQAVHVLLANGKHFTQRTLASELQPLSGDMQAVYILGGLLLLRRLAPLKAPPFLRDPAFCLVCMTWVLGFKVGRFWEDWGWPALMVLVASDLQLLAESRLAFDSFRRLAFAFVAAVVAFLSITTDAGNRWTYNLTQQYLSVAEHPELEGWMPESGGILYSTDMSVFYQTFFKNPHGDWRYILGFESTLMKPEDFEVYHRVLWNFGDAKGYQPWLKKMTPADRLVIRGGRSSPPSIPQLEWDYGVSGTWIGRLPGPHPSGKPATVPSTEPMSSLTNSPDATDLPN